MNQDSGWIIVDKPSGPTSRRIVDQISRALKIKKVGHAGTLDPFAEGVLILAWNRATPLVPFFQDLPKTYEVEAELGRATDTQDRTGSTTQTDPWDHLSLADVEEAMKPFRGVIEQVPPMYSALRHEGNRLYDLARDGITVERPARRRTVFNFKLTHWAPPFVRFEVECEGGTYVRTLIHDLGIALGSSAVVTRLRRTAIGSHRVERALAGDNLQDVTKEQVLQFSNRLAAAVPHLPSVVLEDAAEQRSVICGSWTDHESRVAEGEPHRVLSARGELLAIVERRPELKFHRVFGERFENDGVPVH